MRFDPPQPCLVVSKSLLDLSAADAQHPSQLLERRLVIEHNANLLETQAEIPQGQQTVQSSELGNPVRAVPGVRVDVHGAQQPNLVVVPQHAGRDVTEASEVSDVQHDTTIDTL
jgi:hypothetical protein